MFMLRTGLRRWLSTKPLNPIQEGFLKEQCILVDEKDSKIGTLSKKECHLVQSNGDIPLHRAFSVFLFNMSGHLLLQKRSDEKITYPGHYTNSCCSHPIADVPGEDDGLIGVKHAARRRLNYELGIPVDDVPLEKLRYITRIHYKDTGDGMWGEHEIDYVLFMQANVSLTPNPNEISEVSFVPYGELDSFLPELNAPLTPWFQLIVKNRLKLWWNNLDDLDQFVDDRNILKLT